MSSQFNGLLQTTQFSVRELFLITEFGTFDISMIFDELNLFDNMLTPCMSGNILVTDATNIKDKLKLNGNEFIKITIDKGENNPTFFTKAIYILCETDYSNFVDANMIQRKGTYHGT